MYQHIEPYLLDNLYTLFVYFHVDIDLNHILYSLLLYQLHYDYHLT